MTSTQSQHPPQSHYPHQSSATAAVSTWPSGNPELFHMDSDDMLLNQHNITRNTLDPTYSHSSSQNALGIADNSMLGSSATNTTTNMFSMSAENPHESLGLQVPPTHQMPNPLTLVHGGSRPSLHLDVPSPTNTDLSVSPLSAGYGGQPGNLTAGLGLELDVPLPDRGYGLLNQDGPYIGSYDSSHSYSRSRNHSPAHSPYGGSPYPPSSPNLSVAASIAGGSPYPYSSSPRNIPLPPSGRQTPLLDMSGQSPMGDGSQPSPSPTREGGGVGKLRGRLPPQIQASVAPFTGYSYPASAPPDSTYPSLAQGVVHPFEPEVEGPSGRGRQLPPARRHRAQLSQSAHPDMAPQHSPFSNEGAQLIGHGTSYVGGPSGSKRASDVNNRFSRGVNASGGAAAHTRRLSDAHGTSPYAQPPGSPSNSGQGAGMAMSMGRRAHGSGGSAQGLDLNTNLNNYTSTDPNLNGFNSNLAFNPNSLSLPEIETASNVGNELSTGVVAGPNEFQFDPSHYQQFLQPGAMLGGNMNISLSPQGAQNESYQLQSQSQPQQSQLQSMSQHFTAPWSPQSVDNEEHPPASPSVFSPAGISPIGSGSHPHSPWTSHPASPRLHPMSAQTQAQVPSMTGLTGVGSPAAYGGQTIPDSSGTYGANNEDGIFTMDPNTSSTGKAYAIPIEMAVDPHEGAASLSHPYTLDEINNLLRGVTGFEQNQPSLSMRANNSNFGDANNLEATLGPAGGGRGGADPAMSVLTPIEEYNLAGAAVGMGFINNLIGEVPTTVPQPMGTPLPYMQTLSNAQVQGSAPRSGSEQVSLADFMSQLAPQDVPPSPRPGTQVPWGADGQLRSNSYDHFIEQQQLQDHIRPQTDVDGVLAAILSFSQPQLEPQAQQAPPPMTQPNLNVPTFTGHNNSRQTQQGRPRAYSSTSERSPSPNPAGLSRNRSEKANAHQGHRRFASQTPQITITQHGEHGHHGPPFHAPSAPPFTQVHPPDLQRFTGHNQQQQAPQPPASAPPYVNMQPRQNAYQQSNDNQPFHQISQMSPAAAMMQTSSYFQPGAPNVAHAPGFAPQPVKEDYSDYSDYSVGQQDTFFANPTNPTAGANLTRHISNPANQAHKQQQPGQRAKVNETLLRTAFTNQSKRPDPALRKLLDIVLESQFYYDETLEPMMGTYDAELIFAQVREIAPHDPRFAPKPINGVNGDPSASGSNMTSSSYATMGVANGLYDVNDGTGPQKDAQSIYNLFQENNGCLICCNKQTDRNARALAHIRSDLGHRPYHCTKELMGCRKCSKTEHPRKFFSHNLLEDHISGQVKKQECTQCHTSIRRGGMRRHWLAKHPELTFVGRELEEDSHFPL